VCGQDVAHGAKSFAALDPIHGRDQTWMGSPGLAWMPRSRRNCLM
jgi:hypothetical protein